jgi:2-polyprenyl-6-methoxyphenol hydroxylase-like FAD-dependent oxidoreductase
MFGRRKTEVLVVGAGPVGLLSALQLIRHDVDVEVIDAEWRASDDAYVVALEPKTIHQMVEAGLRRVLDIGKRIDRVALFDGQTPMAQLALNELPSQYPFLLLLPKARLVALLEDVLTHHGVRIRWCHRLSGVHETTDVVHCDVDVLEKHSAGYAVSHTEWAVASIERVTALLCIGTDGGHSIVRRQLEIDRRELAPAEQYVMFAAQTASPVDTIEIDVSERGCSARWPLGEGRTQWSLRVDGRPITSGSATENPHVVRADPTSVSLSETRLADVIHQSASTYDDAVGEIDWAVEARFERRLVDRFGAGRIWLAGGAAHITSPIAAHDLNLGLQEASDLASRCIAVIRNGATIDHLDGYDVSARRRWSSFTPTPIVRAMPGAAAWVRDNAMRIVESIPASGNELRALAHQIGLAVEETVRGS